MHEAIRPHDIATEDMADGLMTQADAEQRDGWPKTLDHGATDACLLRGAGAGGDADVVRAQLFDLIERDLIIAADFHDGSHLAKVLDEVVGEGVVVIDDEEHAGEVPGSWFRV